MLGIPEIPHSQAIGDDHIFAKGDHRAQRNIDKVSSQPRFSFASKNCLLALAHLQFLRKP